MKPQRMALTIVGVVLIATAMLLAGAIPKAAHEDYGRLVKAAGGRLSVTPGYPSVYRQMCAQQRMLQNLYLGAAGLIFLGAGLCGRRRTAEPEN